MDIYEKLRAVGEWAVGRGLDGDVLTNLPYNGGMLELRYSELAQLAHPAPANGDAEALRAALQEIKDTQGKVCDEFELCKHRACTSSYSSWAIAADALSAPAPSPLAEAERAVLGNLERYLVDNQYRTNDASKQEARVWVADGVFILEGDDLNAEGPSLADLDRQVAEFYGAMRRHLSSSPARARSTDGGCGVSACPITPQPTGPTSVDDIDGGDEGEK